MNKAKREMMKVAIIGLTALTIARTVLAGGGLYSDGVLPPSLEREVPYESTYIKNANKAGAVVDLRPIKEEKQPTSAKSGDDMELRLEALLAAQEELQKAKNIRERAEIERQEMLDEQRKASAEELEIVRQRAKLMEEQTNIQLAKQTLDPMEVLNSQVSVRTEGATLKEIVEQIMPRGWTVTPIFKKGSTLETKRFMFRTTDPRDTALRTLFSSIRGHRLYYQIFWDMVDENGSPAPEIIITDSKQG